MKAAFTHALNECLKARYGKLPSAAVLARDFNLRAYGVTPITQESARRWMRGEAFPKSNSLEILWTWLGLSLDAAVSTPQKRDSALHLHGIAHGPGYITPMNPGQEHLAQLFISLNPEQKKAVIELIETCFLGRGGKDSVYL